MHDEEEELAREASDNGPYAGTDASNKKKKMEARTRLFLLHKRRLFMKIVSIVGQNDVEDVLQNTHMRLLNCLYDYYQGTPPIVFLLRVALTESLGLLRKRKIWGLTIDPDRGQEPVGTVKTADSVAMSIREGLGKLDEKLRRVLELRFYEDMGYAEIGDVLGISITTAWNRCQQGLNILRGFLDGG